MLCVYNPAVMALNAGTKLGAYEIDKAKPGAVGAVYDRPLEFDVLQKVSSSRSRNTSWISHFVCDVIVSVKYESSLASESFSLREILPPGEGGLREARAR